MNRFITVWILGIVITLGGCVHSNAPSTNRAVMATNNRGLVQWWTDEALPYIEWEAVNHTWLKGRPVEVVPMKNGEVVAEGNALNLEFRKAIVDRLAKVRGITLAWRGPIQWNHHHRNLKELQCNDVRPPALYIGIETRLSSVNNNLLVDIRALDLREGWVPGFGINWAGKIGPAELAALSVPKTAEHLRGLRSLPFTDDQADLIASYLATNLSCLIHQLGEENVRIYQKDMPGLIDYPAIGIVFRLTDNYLNQLRKVEIVEQEANANVILKREFVQIDGTLHMVWIQSVFIKDGRRIPGSDTEVYIRL